MDKEETMKLELNKNAYKPHYRIVFDDGTISSSIGHSTDIAIDDQLRIDVSVPQEQAIIVLGDAIEKKPGRITSARTKMSEPMRDLNAEERKELAEYMIGLWKRYSDNG